MIRHQIDSDGSAVWVTGHDGSCIARFGRMGIDIHRTVTEQQDGMGECLYCSHGPTTEGHWEDFKTQMLRLHGIAVDDGHRPCRFNPA